MNPVNKVKASFGYRLEVIKQSKSIAGKCPKTFCNFLALGDILRSKWFMVLALRSFFSLLIFSFYIQDCGRSFTTKSLGLFSISLSSIL